ncbi:hypothetical protein [Amycolatopsis taiwanensis]|uniref:Gram-positive cocci surface proteins LPxTG domain-containing protein n=1 Tax=Amycolatopsis taiwanensis TaxID=342230 RepID=A0A9W6R399_9PSEU|nr:hypothetical protein [Amycolatopsis taiwanensis]GLY68463.1 hypothetical protein Atai01_50820 [Amycolatopsis taiwanensis]
MIKKLLAGLMLSVVVLLAVPGMPASAVTSQATVALSKSVGPLAQQATAPPGPRIDPAETDRANAEKTKNKVVIGLIVLVLAAIVVGGRYLRRKKRKAAKS